MSDSLNFLALEPRIMFDGAMAGDVADHMADDTVDQPDAAPEPSQSDKKQVVLVSNAVEDSADLANAVKDGVISIVYDAGSSLDSILDSLKASLNGEKADSIALASHNGPLDGSFYINGKLVSAGSLANDAQLQNFFRELGGLIKADGRLDILACDLGATEQGQLVRSLVSDLTGRDVAVSSDETGNSESGGDWDLELGSIDASSYFDEGRLAQYEGTLVATRLLPVYDVSSEEYNPIFKYFTQLGDKFVFRAEKSSTNPSPGLFISDGTLAGTTEITHPDWVYDPNLEGEHLSDFYVAGDTLYFSARTAAEGRELWTTDGTLENTRLFFNGDGTDASTHTKVLHDRQNLLFLQVTGLHPTLGIETYKVVILDLQSGGTLQISEGLKPLDIFEISEKIIIPTYGKFTVFDFNTHSTQEIAGEYMRSDFQVVDGKIYYFAGASDRDLDLWVFNPDDGSDTLVASLSPDGHNGTPSDMHVINGKLIFSAKPVGGTTTELWVSDRTELGTKMIKDFAGDDPLNLEGLEYNGHYYFSAPADDGTPALWRTDGTEEGTVLIKTGQSRLTGFDMSISVVHDNLMYFKGYIYGAGTELWVSDGTAEGTKPEADLRPGSSSSSIQDMFAHNGDVYLAGREGDAFDIQLYKLVFGNNRDPSVAITDKPIYHLTKDDVAIAPNGTLSDLDGDTEWNGGELMVQFTQNGSAGDVIYLKLQDGGFSLDNTSLSYDGTVVARINNGGSIGETGTLTIKFNSNATNAIAQEVLRSLYFKNTQTSTNTNDRTIEIIALDKDFGQTYYSRTLGINQVPVLSASTDPVVYPKGNSGVSIGFGASIGETGSLEGATLEVVISGNAETTDSLFFSSTVYTIYDGSLYRGTTKVADMSSSSVIGSGTLQFTFTDSATSGDMSAVWSAMMFKSVATEPSPLDREVTVTVTDKDGAEVEHKRKIVVNYDPEFERGEGGNLPHIAGTTPIVLDKGATVSDANAWNKGSFRFQNVYESTDTSFMDQDFLVLKLDPTTGLSVSGTNILYQGTTIVASLSVEDGKAVAGEPLVITFNENATNDMAQTIYRSVTFGTTSDTAPPGQRIISMALKDNAGVTAWASYRITVQEPPSTVAVTPGGEKVTTTQVADTADAPVSVLQDPVNEATQDSGVPTFVNPQAQFAGLGVDGARTFLGAPTFDPLGTDGQRTVIRAAEGGDAPATGGFGAGPAAGVGAAGQGFGGFQGLGANGLSDGFSDTGFNPNAQGMFGIEGEFLENGQPQGQAATDAQQNQAQLKLPTRAGFSQQLANAGRSLTFANAESLLAANNQLLKI